MGEPGVGKSTLAAAYPNPVFVCTEDGVGDLDVEAYDVAENWSDLMGNLRELATEEHDRKTIVLDSLDWTERLCWDVTCTKHGKNSIEDFGYGKGYVEALKTWGELRKALDHFVKNGINVVLICHTHQKTVTPPDGESYDQYQPRLHYKAWHSWVEWSTEVFAALHNRTIRKDDSGKGKVRASRRVIYTQPDSGFTVAKNRLDLPEILPFNKEDIPNLVPVMLGENVYAEES